MLLVLLVLSTLGYFYVRVFTHNARSRTVSSILIATLIAVCSLVITLHFSIHLGLTEATNETITVLTGNKIEATKIKSSKSEKAYQLISKNGKRTLSPGLNTRIYLHRTSSRKATLVTKAVRLKGTSDISNLLFAGSTLNGKLSRQQYYLSIPSNWIIQRK